MDGRLPSMKQLKAEKEQLLQQKEQAQKIYHYYQDYRKELSTVCSNVDLILGQTHSRPQKRDTAGEGGELCPKPQGAVYDLSGRRPVQFFQ